MQIPGFPFDIYYLLGFASVVFIVYLGLVQVFNPTDANDRARLERLVRELDRDSVQNQMPSTIDVCSFCKDGRTYSRCTRCKVARYCSGECQLKHWRAGHNLECKPANVDSTSAVSNEGIGTSRTDIFRSDHHRDRDQMPSTSASPYACLVCGDDKADIRCARCKVARYCSGFCQMKHWRAVHNLECKPNDVDSDSAVSNKGIGTSHTDISSSDHLRDRDQMPSTSASPYVCLVCGDDKTDIHCARCKDARYCSGFCQMKHWRAVHNLECKPSNVDSDSAVSNEGIGTSHTGISSYDHQRDRDQMPSTSASPDKCLFCGNGSVDKCCVKCRVARYCSAACQVKHWRAVHRFECNEYKSPANLYTASAVTSERRGASPMGNSSFGPHEGRDQLPTSTASPHNCFVCGDWAKNRCTRCKAVQYCSATCQIKHWDEGHKLECEKFKSPDNVDSPAVSSERRGYGRMGRSSSVHHRDRDKMPSPSASPYICFACGDLAEIHCSGCDLVKYCSQKCLIKHWRAGHRLECKKYESPRYVDCASAVSSKSRISDHVDISNSDYFKDRHQLPSAPASRDFCFVCDDWSDIRCSSCKVVRYCSEACETKHWREGHELECKGDKSPANAYFASAVSSERRGPGHMGTSSSKYQQSKKDGKLPKTVQSPKSTSSKELPSVEECPICISAIHTKPSCPLLTCEICKHKFHSACLLKWFSTSKKSHCPLCQSPFKSKGAAV